MLTCVAASVRPAAKLQSNAHKLVDGAREPVAIPQYPEEALCTELWNRVGEIRRSLPASIAQISLMTSPSPPEEVNTVGTASPCFPACSSACNPTAIDSF